MYNWIRNLADFWICGWIYGLIVRLWMDRHTEGGTKERFSFPACSLHPDRNGLPSPQNAGQIHIFFFFKNSRPWCMSIVVQYFSWRISTFEFQLSPSRRQHSLITILALRQPCSTRSFTSQEQLHATLQALSTSQREVVETIDKWRDRLGFPLNLVSLEKLIFPLPSYPLICFLHIFTHSCLMLPSSATYLRNCSYQCSVLWLLIDLMENNY